MYNPYNVFNSFMNGNMPVQDPFVAQGFAGSDTYRHGHSRGGPFHGGWPAFGESGGPDGSGERSPWTHDFPHRPHPRRQGRDGSRHRRHRRHHPSEADENVDQPVHSEHGQAGDDIDMTPDTEGTITLEDNEKSGEKNTKDTKDTKASTDDAHDPDISVPQENDRAEDSASESASDAGSCGPRCPRREKNQTHPRRCRRGMREGHGGHGSHGPFRHWGGRHGSGPWGWNRGRGGHGRGGHGHFGAANEFFGPGHRGPPFSRDARPNNGAPGFDDLMRALAADPRLQGLGDMLGNVFQAVGSAVAPGAARGSGGSNGDYRGAHEGANGNAEVSFRPVADIYDRDDAYIVHLVLPGARKENISLDWNESNHELRVAGIVARDGDEETIQSLALAERHVGMFERTVRPGVDRVDADGITARMENGILVVNVPKRKEEEQWTEVHRVNIL